MDHVETTQARACLDSRVDRADETGEPIILTRDGRKIAVIDHVEDAEYLQGVKDRLDLEAFEGARADAEKHDAIRWEQVKAALGL